MFLPLQEDNDLGYFDMNVSIHMSFFYLLMHLYSSINLDSSCL